MITIGEIEGFKVGQASDSAAKTGCTVILCPQGAVASAYTPGFAPGSRETELLKPSGLVQAVHGLCLSGGSAFGLAAAGGAVRFLSKLKAGLDIGPVRVPIVPAAVICDYPANQSGGLLPDEAMGFEAAWSAESGPVPSGPYGAGFSARSGKLGGEELASPSGIGSFGVMTKGGLAVAALAVVNPLGSIVSPRTGEIISGLKVPSGRLAGRREILAALAGAGTVHDQGHTVLAAVATNAAIGKLDAWRLARMAGCGIARAVYPAHLLFDGDTVFALSTARGPAADISFLGALAAEVLAEAIVRSVPGLEISAPDDVLGNIQF
jgi:L-aminopeptidase/D-esterase-like protein